MKQKHRSKRQEKKTLTPPTQPKQSETPEIELPIQLRRIIKHPQTATPTDVLQMQRVYGNQFVQRILKQKPSVIQRQDDGNKAEIKVEPHYRKVDGPKLRILLSEMELNNGGYIVPDAVIDVTVEIDTKLVDVWFKGNYKNNLVITQQDASDMWGEASVVRVFYDSNKVVQSTSDNDSSTAESETKTDSGTTADSTSSTSDTSDDTVQVPADEPVTDEAATDKDDDKAEKLKEILRLTEADLQNMINTWYEAQKKKGHHFQQLNAGKIKSLTKARVKYYWTYILENGDDNPSKEQVENIDYHYITAYGMENDEAEKQSKSILDDLLE